MISVALATYNGSKFLDAQIQSILNQTYTDFELVIIDDCSTDNTFELLKNYKDSRIILFQNDKNLGFRKNFEKIIQNCSGEYIAFCDQDDAWFPDHLQILLDNIKDNFYIGGNALLVNENLEDMNVTMLQSLGVDFVPEKQEDWFKFLLFTNVFQGTASLVQSDFVKGLLPFSENIKFHDHWLAINAAIKNKVVYINHPLLKYRQHGNNVTYNNKFNVLNRIKLHFVSKNNAKKIIYSFLKEISISDLNNEQTDLLKVAEKFWGKSSFFKRIKIAKWYSKNYESVKGSNNQKLKIVRIVKYLYNL